MLDELLDELVGPLLPDHPAVVYGLPTVLLGGWLVAAADPVPALAIGAGLLLSVCLSFAYEHTELGRESTGGERSTADRIALGVLVLLVVGIVVVGELDAVSLAVSPTQFAGGLAGLLAGASAVEWLLPALRARVG